VELLKLLEALKTRHWQGVVQAGGTAQGIGMPGVVAAGAQYPGDVGGGGYAHACAHIAEIAGVLEQHHRCGPRVGEHGGAIDGGALSQRDHACGRREWREAVEHSGVDLPREREQASAELGRKPAG